jgi:hypothetical protein
LEFYSADPKTIIILDEIRLETPILITSWITTEYERPNKNIELLKDTKGYTYSYALKMRATVSYVYTFEQEPGKRD